MNAQEVLAQPSVKAVLAGTEREIHPLYFDNTLRLLNVLADVRKELLAGIQGKSSDVEIMHTVFSAAGDKFPEVLSLIIGSPVSDADAKKVTLTEMSALSRVVVKINNVRQIYEDFSAAVAEVMGQLSPTPPKANRTA